MSKEKNELLQWIILILLVILILITLFYAFFRINTQHNPKLKNGNVTMIFDGENGFNELLNFNTTTSKKFTLKNVGNKEEIVTLNWFNLVNTYTDGSLTYTLSINENKNSTFKTVIPKTNVPISKEKRKEDLTTIKIPANSTYYFDLAITLNDLPEVNQSSDFSASFHAELSLK